MSAGSELLKSAAMSNSGKARLRIGQGRRGEIPSSFGAEGTRAEARAGSDCVSRSPRTSRLAKPGRPFLFPLSQPSQIRIGHGRAYGDPAIPPRPSTRFRAWPRTDFDRLDSKMQSFAATGQPVCGNTTAVGRPRTLQSAARCSADRTPTRESRPNHDASTWTPTQTLSGLVLPASAAFGSRHARAQPKNSDRVRRPLSPISDLRAARTTRAHAPRHQRSRSIKSASQRIGSKGMVIFRGLHCRVRSVHGPVWGYSETRWMCGRHANDLNGGDMRSLDLNLLLGERLLARLGHLELEQTVFEPGTDVLDRGAFGHVDRSSKCAVATFLQSKVDVRTWVGRQRRSGVLTATLTVPSVCSAGDLTSPATVTRFFSKLILTSSATDSQRVSGWVDARKLRAERTFLDAGQLDRDDVTLLDLYDVQTGPERALGGFTTFTRCGIGSRGSGVGSRTEPGFGGGRGDVAREEALDQGLERGVVFDADAGVPGAVEGELADHGEE